MAVFNGWNGPRQLGFCLLLAVAFAAGCRSTSWREPSVLPAKTSFEYQIGDPHQSGIAAAEMAYALGSASEANDSEACVDQYFEAATLSWCEAANQTGVTDPEKQYGAELYRSALTKLITTGQRFGRFDPSQGLVVECGGKRIVVPTSYHGFLWRPEDFNHLVPVGTYRTNRMSQFYSAPGIGVATVAVNIVSTNVRFRKPRQLCATTVVLRPTFHGASVTHPGQFTIEMYDSLRVSSITTGQGTLPLRRDITAPLAYSIKDERTNYLEAFFRPGESRSNAGLFMIEPFQPGKIPIILVHGLLSDPSTWANIANELRANPDIMQRYQIWGFEYATGDAFLQSAALLRRQLVEAQAFLDPTGSDEALSNIVLVGHSMGGLVSKLQVTTSGNTIWQSVSNRPLDSIAATQQAKNELADFFYFRPGPAVTRVVYIGTPHQGSPWANRPIGRLGTVLVNEPEVEQELHRQIVRDNPGTFTREFTRRIPTSIDLLKPGSPLLQAINSLPIAEYVTQHSIIGSFRPMLCAGDSDGVVPVSSARLGGVASELVVRGQHTEIHKKRECVDELLAILRQHASTVSCSVSPYAGY